MTHSLVSVPHQTVLLSHKEGLSVCWVNKAERPVGVVAPLNLTFPIWTVGL